MNNAKKHLRYVFPVALGTMPISIGIGLMKGESFAQIVTRCIGVTAISFVLIAFSIFAYWKLVMQRHPK